MSEMGNIYAKNERLGVQEGKVGVVHLFRAAVFFIVIFYYIKQKKDIYFGGIALTYIVFLILSFVVPIVFRFGTYFEIPFYVILSSVIIEYAFLHSEVFVSVFFI